MASSARKRGIIVDINVTPLVDIMLVLLIIFMLTANLIRPSGDRGRAAAGQPEHHRQPDHAGGDADARRGALPERQGDHAGGLRDAVRAAVAADPKTQAIISGDKSVSHGRVVWVLDVVSRSGVTSFATPESILRPHAARGP